MDKNTRFSMWEGFQAGRRTEIDHLRGEIIRLANQHRRPAPLNRHVLALIKDAESTKKGSPGLELEAVSETL